MRVQPLVYTALPWLKNSLHEFILYRLLVQGGSWTLLLPRLNLFLWREAPRFLLFSIPTRRRGLMRSHEFSTIPERSNTAMRTELGI